MLRLDLHADLVDELRSAIGTGDEGDAGAVERALKAYLLGRLMDTTHGRSDVPSEGARRIAYGDVHGQRR
jgi:hypothetical protein